VPLPTIVLGRDSMSDLQIDYSFTLSWVRHHPAGKPFRKNGGDGPDYEAFQTEINSTSSKESELRQHVDDAIVAAYLTDLLLNKLGEDVIDLLPQQKDQDPEAMKQHLLHGLPLSRFLFPVLGQQLESMKAWVSLLQASTLPALKEKGNQLADLLVTATQNEAALQKAEADLEEFLSITGHPRLYKDFNAIRTKVYSGVLGVDPKAAEEFFKHDTSQRSIPLAKSLQASQARMDRLTAALEAEKKAYEGLQAKKKQQDEEEAQRAEAAAQLAQLKKQEEELKKQRKQLESKATKGKKKR
jgi:hypothetical protein